MLLKWGGPLEKKKPSIIFFVYIGLAFRVVFLFVPVVAVVVCTLQILILCQAGGESFVSNKILWCVDSLKVQNASKFSWI